MSEHEFYCENINAGYSERNILNNVSLRIPAGKISVLIGSNGCGKSTLLRVLAGFLIPTSGQVRLDGKQLKKYSAKHKWRRSLQYCRNSLVRLWA